ncbi:ATP-binding protein, partial [Streptomyces sp. NPDC001274]
LLTNVHRHVGDGHPCTVELRWSGRHLTVSVADEGAGMPRLLGTGGGGLSRVMALSDSWGTCRTDEGKVVWFTRYAEEPRSIDRVPLSPLPDGSEFRSPPAAAPAPAEPVAVFDPALV